MSTKTNEPVKQEGDFKIKTKVPKKLSVPESTVKIDLAAMKSKEEPVKIDLTQKDQKDAIQKQETEESVLREERPKVELQAVGQGNKEPVENVIKEIQNDSVDEEVKQTTKEFKESKRDEQVIGKPLPENIEKLVSFMETTGGTVEDYVRLNADYSTIDNESLLREYYKIHVHI